MNISRVNTREHAPQETNKKQKTNSQSSRSDDSNDVSAEDLANFSNNLPKDSFIVFTEGNSLKNMKYSPQHQADACNSANNRYATVIYVNMDYKINTNRFIPTVKEAVGKISNGNGSITVTPLSISENPIRIEIIQIAQIKIESEPTRVPKKQELEDLIKKNIDDETPLRRMILKCYCDLIKMNIIDDEYKEVQLAPVKFAATKEDLIEAIRGYTTKD
jgi:hypothetical protein